MTDPFPPADPPTGSSHRTGRWSRRHCPTCAVSWDHQQHSLNADDYRCWACGGPGHEGYLRTGVIPLTPPDR